MRSHCHIILSTLHLLLKYKKYLINGNILITGHRQVVSFLQVCTGDEDYQERISPGSQQ
jgi:hypothetical protein